MELFIKDVNTQTLLEIAQFCDEVSNFLLVLNLTLQELTLDEVSQLETKCKVDQKFTVIT